jgi:hypothetical protein
MWCGNGDLGVDALNKSMQGFKVTPIGDPRWQSFVERLKASVDESARKAEEEAISDAGLASLPDARSLMTQLVTLGTDTSDPSAAAFLRWSTMPDTLPSLAVLAQVSVQQPASTDQLMGEVKKRVADARTTILNLDQTKTLKPRQQEVGHMVQQLQALRRPLAVH